MSVKNEQKPQKTAHQTLAGSAKWLGLGLGLCLFLMANSALAQIKRPGAHPKYSFEAEPHLVFIDRFGHGGDGAGPGFRGTVTVVDNGFVSTINNSVGIGFGIDTLLFDNDDHCHRSGGDRYCHGDNAQFFIPVVLQWNFWLHEKWSVFAEPGFAIALRERHRNDDFDDDTDLDLDPFVMFVGGRFLFNDSVGLTLRLGFPQSLSFGVSFFL